MSEIKLPKESLAVINIGLEGFAEDLKKQGISVTNLDWKPPMDIPAEVYATLRVNQAAIDAANQAALERVNAGQPFLVGMGIARSTKIGRAHV